MKITNWDKWQSFRKDRGTPPWIKVHRNLLSNEEWVSLSDKEKGQLISIWLLAADKNGNIPDSPAIIQRMAMLESKPNINKFIELGFLSTTCQPDGCQHDTPEKSRVEKSRVEEIAVKNEFSLPAEINNNVWNEFEQHRKEIRKPLTDKARSINAKILRQLTHDEQKYLVDYSIGGRYTGLFPEQLKKRDNNGSHQQTLTPQQQLDNSISETQKYLDSLQ